MFFNDIETQPHGGLLSPARFTRSDVTESSRWPAQPRSLYSLRCHREFTLTCSAPLALLARVEIQSHGGLLSPARFTRSDVTESSRCAAGPLSRPVHRAPRGHNPRQGARFTI